MSTQKAKKPRRDGTAMVYVRAYRRNRHKKRTAADAGFFLTRQSGIGIIESNPHGGVKVSTGIVRYGKRVVAPDHYKTDNSKQ